ncbi:MAG: hypothetical protein HY788_05895 [Deltaproteobacteria bacterium]|nr:hypothetical protein [Deltaproteobacteria bacterium]
MMESVKLVLAFVFLILVYFLTRLATARRQHKAATSIIEELKEKRALDLFSATELPYAHAAWLRFGLKDYRRNALKSLVSVGIIVRTEDNKYYLRSREA